MIARLQFQGEPLTIVANAHARLTGDEKIDIPLELVVERDTGRLLFRLDATGINQALTKRDEAG